MRAELQVHGATVTDAISRCYPVARKERLMRQKAVSLSLFFLIAPMAHSQAVPAEFVRDRIFVLATSSNGDRVRFLTDTGGGWNALSDTANAGLKLAQRGDVEVDAGRAPLVDPGALFHHSKIPAPVRDEPWLHGMLVVAPARQFADSDGTLGSRWFAGRVWDIDYGRHTMRVLASRQPPAGSVQVELGFVTDEKGNRALNFPRVTITVDGKPIDVLLDTGASAKLTSGAAAEFHYEPGMEVGTSFVIRSIFDHWRALHPEWRTIPDADARGGFPMIEVPTVEIGGIAVGPVWFTLRPDPNFLEFMSQMTDQVVSGAIGGSALKYLRIVLDYPGARMYLQKKAE
jgi:predicted aspartyl protease